MSPPHLILATFDCFFIRRNLPSMASKLDNTVRSSGAGNQRVRPFDCEAFAGAANAVGATQTRSEEERKTAWGCIYLCTLFTFSATLQFYLFMSSLWPFMQNLDSAVTEGFFGLVIAMYSLSQIFASPLLGIWSNRLKRVKPPLIFCNCLMLIGNLLYFAVQLFPAAHTRYVLIVSRLIAGCGISQVSLLKAFASQASTVGDRSRATAYITGGNALGLTLGPAIQMLFSGLGFPGLRLCLTSTGQWCIPSIRLSIFTAPALFASVCNVAMMVLLVCWFRESYVGVMEQQRCKKANNGTGAQSSPAPPLKLPPYDRWAIHMCYALRFTQFFIYTNIETIGTAYAMMMFAWSPTEVVFYDSIAHCVRGLITLGVYMAYIVLDLGRRLSHRLVCLVALLAMLLFHVCTFSWPFLPRTVQKMADTPTNSTSIVGAGGGCNARRMDWCDGLTAVNVWVYYAAMIVLIGVAWPNINVTMNTLFSLLIGPRIQSKQQGVLEMYGGMGRLVGPLVMGYLYSTYGPRAIWILESAEITLMVVLWLAFYPRLVPLRVHSEQKVKNTEFTRDNGNSIN